METNYSGTKFFTMPDWLKQEFKNNYPDIESNNIIGWTTIDPSLAPNKYHYFMNSENMLMIFIPFMWFLLPIFISQYSVIETKFKNSTFLIIHKDGFILHKAVQYKRTYIMKRYNYNFSDDLIKDFSLELHNINCYSTTNTLIIKMKNDDIITISCLYNINVFCELLKKTLREYGTTIEIIKFV